MEFLDVDKQAIFEEIVDRGREQAVVDQETYNDLCEEIVQERVDAGEIDKDSSTVGMSEMLKGRWLDYKEELGLDSSAPQL